MTMLVYNLFHAFYFFNVKKPLRDKLDKYRVAAYMAAELLSMDMHPQLRSP